MYRFSSLCDLALNIAGAIIGLVVSWRWQISILAIKVNKWIAGFSVLAALAVLGHVAILLLSGPLNGNLLSVDCQGQDPHQGEAAEVRVASFSGSLGRAVREGRSGS